MATKAKTTGSARRGPPEGDNGRGAGGFTVAGLDRQEAARRHRPAAGPPQRAHRSLADAQAHPLERGRAALHRRAQDARPPVRGGGGDGRRRRRADRHPGRLAQGTPGALVAARTWDDYSIGRADAISHLGSARPGLLRGSSRRTARPSTTTEEPDPVTQDMLIGQSAQLEQFQWFVRAHLENAGGDAGQRRGRLRGGGCSQRGLGMTGGPAGPVRGRVTSRPRTGDQTVGTSTGSRSELMDIRQPAWQARQDSRPRHFRVADARPRATRRPSSCAASSSPTSSPSTGRRCLLAPSADELWVLEGSDERLQQLIEQEQTVLEGPHVDAGFRPRASAQDAGARCWHARRCAGQHPRVECGQQPVAACWPTPAPPRSPVGTAVCWSSSWGSAVDALSLGSLTVSRDCAPPFTPAEAEALAEFSARSWPPWCSNAGGRPPMWIASMACCPISGTSRPGCWPPGWVST